MNIFSIHYLFIVIFIFFTPLPKAIGKSESLPFAENKPLSTDYGISNINVAAASHWYPYAGRDKDGKGVGPAYKLIKQILTPYGIKINIQKDKPWKRYVKELKNGYLDVILTAYKVNPFGEYTEHYSIDEVKIFVKPGNEFIFTGIKDLSGKIGIQPKGAEYDLTLSQRSPENNFIMRENSDMTKCIEMVLNGAGDYYISAYYDVQAKLKAAGYENKLIALEKPVYVEEVVMVVSRKSPLIKLLPQINRKIIELRENGTINKLMNEYMKNI